MNSKKFSEYQGFFNFMDLLAYREAEKEKINSKDGVYKEESKHDELELLQQITGDLIKKCNEIKTKKKRIKNLLK